MVLSKNVIFVVKFKLSFFYLSPQSSFPFLPDSGERKVLLLLVELHRLVFLHPVRRFHPVHVQRLPVIEVRHLLVCELFSRPYLHHLAERIHVASVSHAFRYQVRTFGCFFGIELFCQQADFRTSSLNLRTGSSVFELIPSGISSSSLFSSTLPLCIVPCQTNQSGVTDKACGVNR